MRPELGHHRGELCTLKERVRAHSVYNLLGGLNRDSGLLTNCTPNGCAPNVAKASGESSSDAIGLLDGISDGVSEIAKAANDVTNVCERTGSGGDDGAEVVDSKGTETHASECDSDEGRAGVPWSGSMNVNSWADG